MAIIPTTFPQPAEAAVASYDHKDLAEGTGTMVVEGFVAETSSAETYKLSEQILYSRKIECSYADAAPASTAWVLRYEKDFDLTAFNLPRTIKGTGFIQHTFGGFIVGGSSGVPQGKMNYLLRKVSGGSPSEIVSGTSQSVPAGQSQAICIPLTVPKTHFKKGDILRLTLNGYGITTGDRGAHYYFGTDPKNRDSVAVDKYLAPSANPITFTNLRLNIPFEIDL